MPPVSDGRIGSSPPSVMRCSHGLVRFRVCVADLKVSAERECLGAELFLTHRPDQKRTTPSSLLLENRSISVTLHHIHTTTLSHLSTSYTLHTQNRTTSPTFIPSLSTTHLHTTSNFHHPTRPSRALSTPPRSIDPYSPRSRPRSTRFGV